MPKQFPWTGEEWLFLSLSQSDSSLKLNIPCLCCPVIFTSQLLCDFVSNIPVIVCFTIPSCWAAPECKSTILEIHEHFRTTFISVGCQQCRNYISKYFFLVVITKLEVLAQIPRKVKWFPILWHQQSVLPTIHLISCNSKTGLNSVDFSP